MTPPDSPKDAASGPSLETYVETRFNLLIEFINEKFAAQDVAMRAFVDSTKTLIHANRETFEKTQIASDLRYQQRFEAQSDALAAAFMAQQTAMKTALESAKEAVNSALAAADRAVLKAELASDKRFESVNEFRQTLADQQRTFMPRAEADVNSNALSASIAGVTKLVDSLIAERMGIKGGWGYAVGVAGFLAILFGFWVAFRGL